MMTTTNKSEQFVWTIHFYIFNEVKNPISIQVFYTPDTLELDDAFKNIVRPAIGRYMTQLEWQYRATMCYHVAHVKVIPLVGQALTGFGNQARIVQDSINPTD